jgi:hypothetical protein
VSGQIRIEWSVAVARDPLPNRARSHGAVTALDEPRRMPMTCSNRVDEPKGRDSRIVPSGEEFSTF